MLAGKIWTPAGVLVALSAIILPEQIALVIMLMITGIIITVPVVYSYQQYHLTKV